MQTIQWVGLVLMTSSISTFIGLQLGKRGY